MSVGSVCAVFQLSQQQCGSYTVFQLCNKWTPKPTGYARLRRMHL